jgi:DNA repair protein RecO (recombination protein O)
MTKVDLTPAFLIHRRSFKDSSLLLDFFTQDHGKIRLVGRGLRSSKTNIQMFQHLNISFSGKGDLKTLSNWEVDDTPRNITGEALILSMYVNELVSRLLHEHDPYPELFEFYKQFVNQVSNLEQDTRYWSLRLFENNLLSELGYALDFSQDVGGLSIDKNAFYEYQPQSGFSQSSIGKMSGNLLNQLLSESLEDLPNKDQLKVCRDLNRQRLSVLLGDKPLKSRELFFTKN